MTQLVKKSVNGDVIREEEEWHVGPLRSTSDVLLVQPRCLPYTRYASSQLVVDESVIQIICCPENSHKILKKKETLKNETKEVRIRT